MQTSITYPQQQKPQNVPQQNPQNLAPQTQPQPQQKSKGKKEVDYSQKSVRELANLLSKIEKDKKRVSAELTALTTKRDKIAEALAKKINPNG